MLRSHIVWKTSIHKPHSEISRYGVTSPTSQFLWGMCFLKRTQTELNSLINCYILLVCLSPNEDSWISISYMYIWCTSTACFWLEARPGLTLNIWQFWICCVSFQPPFLLSTARNLREIVISGRLVLNSLQIHIFLQKRLYYILDGYIFTGPVLICADIHGVTPEIIVSPEYGPLAPPKSSGQVAPPC